MPCVGNEPVAHPQVNRKAINPITLEKMHKYHARRTQEWDAEDRAREGKLQVPATPVPVGNAQAYQAATPPVAVDRSRDSGGPATPARAASLGTPQPARHSTTNHREAVIDGDGIFDKVYQKRHPHLTEEQQEKWSVTNEILEIIAKESQRQAFGEEQTRSAENSRGRRGAQAFTTSNSHQSSPAVVLAPRGKSQNRPPRFLAENVSKVDSDVFLFPKERPDWRSVLLKLKTDVRRKERPLCAYQVFSNYLLEEQLPDGLNEYELASQYMLAGALNLVELREMALGRLWSLSGRQIDPTVMTLLLWHTWLGDYVPAYPLRVWALERLKKCDDLGDRMWRLDYFKKKMVDPHFKTYMLDLMADVMKARVLADTSSAEKLLGQVAMYPNGQLRIVDVFSSAIE